MSACPDEAFARTAAAQQQHSSSKTYSATVCEFEEEDRGNTGDDGEKTMAVA